MASNLACIGLGVANREEFDELVEWAMADAERIGKSGRTEVYRWQDQSGARLVMEARHGTIEGVLPSYDALPGAQLTEVMLVDDDVATATVIEGEDAEATQLAVEFEERRLVLSRRTPVAGRASIVGLGVAVELFEDADAFELAPASLLHGDEEHVPEPPPHVVEFGLSWPPRMSAESLISYGVFAEPHDIDAYARLNGTVLGASTRTVARTGQAFHAVRVRTVGFELEVCIPTDAHPDLPRTGQIIGGTVFLVGSIGAAERVRARLHLPGRR